MTDCLNIMDMRKIIIIFTIAFLLNAVWETLHSVLYASYQDGAISSFILLRAALFDAIVISIFAFPFLLYEKLKNRRWLFALFLVAFAVGLEEWALATNRWVYTEFMPIIPFLGVGLTPVIQLGLLGYISFHFVAKIRALA